MGLHGRMGGMGHMGKGLHGCMGREVLHGLHGVHGLHGLHGVHELHGVYVGISSFLSCAVQGCDCLRVLPLFNVTAGRWHGTDLVQGGC